MARLVIISVFWLTIVVNQGREIVKVGTLRKEDCDFIEEIYVQKLKKGSRSRALKKIYKSEYIFAFIEDLRSVHNMKRHKSWLFFTIVSWEELLLLFSLFGKLFIFFYFKQKRLARVHEVSIDVFIAIVIFICFLENN